MKILIAGAGIGGLTAAVALRRLGLDDIVVVEQAAVLKEVGAGVQLGPNAVKVLHRLGLEQPLAAAAVAPLGTQSRNWSSGRIIRDFPLGDTYRQRYGAPHYHLHRADLHAILAEAAGQSALRLASRFTGFSQDAGGVTLHLASGEALKGDVLIGADGVHSVIRAGRFGPDAPRFSGLVAWRGLAPVERLARFPIEKHTHAWWGPHKHFVHYYVSGGRLMNWVGVVPAGEWRLESWSARGEKSEALAEFAGWHPVVRAIIEATDEPFKWALYDRDPRPGWSEGRVTLLGDAAHSMLPFMSQGAAQSVEDGYVLALCLARSPRDVPAALKRYESLRFERTRRVQLGSRANGEVFHLSSPFARFMRDLKFRIASFTRHSDIHRRLDWLFGYDCDEAVARQASPH
jgi:salicylate hydroxylase